MRFNIRESVETDSEGNPLSPEQIEFFKNSKIRDGQGRLLVCYHGTDKEFNVFAKDLIGANTHNSGFFGKGFYFTNDKDTAEFYSNFNKRIPQTKSLYLNIINPFMWNDYRTKQDFSKVKKMLGLSTEIEFSNGYAPYAINQFTNGGDADKFSSALAKKGFDGIIFSYDGETFEIIAFEPNQIKSITNKTPTNSDNINEATSIKEDPTSGVSSAQKSRNRQSKRTIRSIAKQLNAEQGIDCSFVVDAKSMTVHHIDDTKGEDGLRNNSFDNLWFICSDDSRDSEVIHKLLHYIERNDIKYDDLLNELNNIKIVKYDDASGKLIPKTLRDFKESCELFNKGLKEDMELNFDRALLDKWIDDLNANGAERHQTFSYTEGGKYIRVSYTYGGRYDTAVFAFVDADGNIYKPAGWKTPAKGVRARIDQNPPMDEKDLYSARYRAAVYGESVNEAYNKDSLHAKLWNMGHKEQTCFQNGYCVTCYFQDGEGMAKRYTVTNRDGKKVLDCNAGFAWQPQIQKFEDSLLQLLNTGSIKEEILTEKPSPAGYEPTKKGIAYKVFKVKNGKLYPPMVANAGGADTPVGVWLDAEEGEFAGLSKTGRPQVKSTGSGNLSYRPGWHLGDVPRAKQFDRLNKETGEYEFPKDFVWAECEYAMDVDYQPESDARGYERTKVDKDGNVIVTKSDKYQHSLAGLPKLPTNGYYKYRTNPNPDTVPWVITGQMKVNRLLSDAEVNAILEKNGIEPIHRQGGDKTLAELGLKEGLGEDWYFHDDDSYFSHEQLLDFASDLEDAIQDRHGMMFTVTSVWFEKDNSLVADVQVGKYGDDMLVSQKVDMRRVKTERDLRKYIPALVDQVTKQAVDDDY